MKAMTVLLLLLNGCSAYTRTHMHLVEQARRGVALAIIAQEQRSNIVEQLYRAQQRELDEAFDADVRSRPGLSADWVIESRRAYAAALDQLAQQRRAGDAATESARQNLLAVDLALQRLWMLQAAQLRLFESLPNPAGANP